MENLVGGIFCENGKKVGPIVAQQLEKPRRVFQMGQLALVEFKRCVRITIVGSYLVGARADGAKDVCEIVFENERLTVFPESSAINAKHNTTDIVLSPFV